MKFYAKIKAKPQLPRACWGFALAIILTAAFVLTQGAPALATQNLRQHQPAGTVVGDAVGREVTASAAPVNAMSSGNPAGMQLSDEDRRELAETLHAKLAGATFRSLGFKIRGQEHIFTLEAIVAQIPLSLKNAELSVCGVKGFIIDEVIEFVRPDGSKEVVDCAFVAALDITDSPVHFHGMTREIYQILSGRGKMVLGNKVVNVKKGAIISIPPLLEHGLVSDSKTTPVRALLFFMPGLAPKEYPEFRDEGIVYDRASERMQSIEAMVALIKLKLTQNLVLVVSKDGSVPEEVRRFLTEEDLAEDIGGFVDKNIIGKSLADYMANKQEYDNKYDPVLFVNEDGTYSLTSIDLAEPLPVAVSLDELRQRVQAWISV